MRHTYDACQHLFTSTSLPFIDLHSRDCQLNQQKRFPLPFQHIILHSNEYCLSIESFSSSSSAAFVPFMSQAVSKYVFITLALHLPGVLLGCMIAPLMSTEPQWSSELVAPQTCGCTELSIRSISELDFARNRFIRGSEVFMSEE